MTTLPANSLQTTTTAYLPCIPERLDESAKVPAINVELSTRSEPIADNENLIGAQSTGLDIVAALKVVLTIIAAMAVGSALVALVVLSSPVRLIGFCVALLMMSFIGLPLIMASITDTHSTA
jgi:hypothetical protein